MKQPMIGLTPELNKEGTYLSVREDFLSALIAAGAVPVMLPLTGDETVLRHCVEGLDGFIFTGGGDVDPAVFGEPTRPWCGAVSPRRDEMELALCRLLLAEKKPVLGVCRGLQVLCVAAGGTVYQDIGQEFRTDCPIAHRQPQPEDCPSHGVTLSEGSLLRALLGDALLGDAPLRVNSLHHQAVKDPGRMVVTARSEDGLCEGAELPGHPFFAGVQWHPERLWRTDPREQAVFEGFVRTCGG